MRNNLISQIVASIAFLLAALAFLNPFHIFMTDMLHMLILALLVAAFGAFTVFLIREQAQDEREEAHRMLAGRAAFLIGAAILLAGIVWQAFTGAVDSWLILALSGMVLAKIGARVYGDRFL